MRDATLYNVISGEAIDLDFGNNSFPASAEGRF